jgi:5-methyltetrahydrofolate--homocysteine methyltransferase
MTHQERWRDRPVDTSATAGTCWCQIRQKREKRLLEDESKAFITSPSREVFLYKRGNDLNKNKHTRPGYLEAIRQRTIIFDGAMGTNLDRQKLTAEHYGGEQYLGCNDHLALTYPKAVEIVHSSFLEAGVDVIETNTFRSNRQTLGEFGLQDKCADINRAAAQLARRVADEYSSGEQPRFAAGSMGPTGKLISLKDEDGPQMDYDTARDIFSQQAFHLIEGGVDLLLLETQQDILEVKAAVRGIRDAFERSGKVLPIQAQVTLDTNGRMLLGTDIQAVLAILEGIGVDVIGLNCSTGPEHMRQPLSYLSRHTHLPISCLPNAGMPINRDGGAYYPLGARDFADQVSNFVRDFNIDVIGGCCGTTPEHLRLLVDEMRSVKRKPREVSRPPELSSAFQAVNMQQEPAPFIIGERLNTQGSRAFKRIMLKQDYEAALQLAVGQMEKGAHALDVCTALTEDEQEAQRTRELVTLLSAQVNAPLVIDSTDPDVLEAGLKAAAGRCLLNSVHLEAGEGKARRILQLAKDYNAAVITLTIDEKGMAKTTADKLAVAKRIYALAAGEFGLKPEDIVFDPLTFTLASGSAETLDAGIQTLEAIRAIKQELPGVLTSLGLSNISYGLNPPARKVLNSVMLYHSVKAGLDMAILNPAQIKPYATISQREKQLAEDLLFNRSPQALAELTTYFENAKGKKDESDQGEKLEALPLPERIRQRILTRKKDGLTADLDAFVQTSDAPAHESALALINQVLLPAMKEIGEQFGKGELILPFVLQSAEIMRAASDHLEQYLEKKSSSVKGRLILATVYGDVHDIGKNLVKTILSNNGYEVIDLGKQVPVETIIQEAISRKADAIGLSALLVSTSQQMPLVLDALQEKDLKLPVLIGGAAVNPEFAERIGAGKDGRAYAGGVYYCQDAFEALKVLDTRPASHLVENIPSRIKKKPVKEADKTKPAVKADIPPAAIPTPPFWGAKVVDRLPVEALFDGLNHNTLFRISWGAKNARGEKWEQYQRDFSRKLEELKAQAEKDDWLQASAAYGFFPCRADGDNLIVYHQKDGDEEGLHFTFPRQQDDRGLCLSDYFANGRSGKRDVAAFQIVSLGQRAVEYVQKLEEEQDMTASFFAHGLAVQITEAAADYLHQMIRRELGLDARQGKRYSWGFPAIPDMSQHELLFKLLPAEEALHIQLTAAFQFVPEYTTAALVLHHPQAAYFKINNQ